MATLSVPAAALVQPRARGAEQMRERPPRDAGEQPHSQHRAAAEDQRVGQPLEVGVEAGEHQRGERAASGEAVDDSHHQGSDRVGTATEVNVRARPGVDVVRRARAAAARLRPFCARPHQGAEPEEEQHHRDQQLEGDGQTVRHRGAQQGKHQRPTPRSARVAEPPERAQPEARAWVILLGDQGGDRREMVGLEGMAHAKEQSEEPGSRGGQGLSAGSL